LVAHLKDDCTTLSQHLNQIPLDEPQLLAWSLWVEDVQEFTRRVEKKSTLVGKEVRLLEKYLEMLPTVKSGILKYEHT